MAKKIINSIDNFVVENIKVSLSFLKRVCPKKKINNENFKLLDEKNAIETSMQLSPCLKGAAGKQKKIKKQKYKEIELWIYI